MVRARIGSEPPANTPRASVALILASAAQVDDPLCPAKRRPSPRLADCADGRAVKTRRASHSPAWLDVLPWIARTARSVAFGCLLALGGCGGAAEREREISPRVSDDSLEAVGASGRGSDPASCSPRSPSTTCRELAPGFGFAEARVGVALDRARVGRAHASWACADCHGEPASVDAGGDPGGSSRDVGCSNCHVAYSDPARVGPHLGAHGEEGCGSCHTLHSRAPAALRLDDRVAWPWGESLSGLGRGAVCVDCHSDRVSSTPGESARITLWPETQLFLGRGARLVPDEPAGSHRLLADSCVRCHGGADDSHERRLLEGREIRSGACAPCHGEGVDPRAIGERDWLGDGEPRALVPRVEAALDALEGSLARALEPYAPLDRCEPARRGVNIVARGEALVWVGEGGVLLGDCESDGSITEGGRAPDLEGLPQALRDAVHDLRWLQRDHSRGVHHPEHTIRVLDAIARALDAD